MLCSDEIKISTYLSVNLSRIGRVPHFFPSRLWTPERKNHRPGTRCRITLPRCFWQSRNSLRFPIRHSRSSCNAQFLFEKANVRPSMINRPERKSTESSQSYLPLQSKKTTVQPRQVLFGRSYHRARCTKNLFFLFKRNSTSACSHLWPTKLPHLAAVEGSATKNKNKTQSSGLAKDYSRGRSTCTAYACEKK